MQQIERAKFEASSAQIFAAAFLAASALAAFLIGSFPLAASIATIFLFAGAHNFFEFRYFLARMPVRWGKSKTYYALGIGGVVVLTGAYLAIFFTGGWLWSADAALGAVALWNTLLVLWVGALFYLRGRHKPRGDYSWVFAPAFALAALAWLAPQYWSLSLVYLHPLVAMFFLERQLRRTKPEWLAAYHFCLASVPFFLLGLYFLLASAPDLQASDELSWRIAQHAGGEILTWLSSRFLVAAHVFLETIHYAVWIVLIPLADRRAIPWRLREIPLVAHREGFPKLAIAAVGVSLLLVAALWLGFSADYAAARDIYFAFAIAHVLAECPFLIKML